VHKIHRQRSNLPADRELNRALSAHRPSSFGIRRRVEPDVADQLLGIMDTAYEEGILPETVVLRERPCVTLLPKRELGKQMAQGIVLGYKLGHAGAKFEHDQLLSNSTPNSLPVELGAVAVHNGHAVYVEVVSDRLDEEKRRMYEILASIGFKGSQRSLQKPHHITLGSSETRMGRIDEKRIAKALEEKIEPGLLIELMPWEPYPSEDEMKTSIRNYDVA
jgi:hypothetical protein